MFGWFRDKGRSKETLRDRLELVLAYDRANIAPGKIDALRADLLEVVRRHFPTGESSIEVEQLGDKMVLSANIPLESARPAPGRDRTAGRP
ncbi:cell division topological specificity factor MinE [Deinococcus lacus]|uniref:Cell division topological specificity factor MinE n=1 Tax=Deinococcus lacus TaxID=392561 RepID=A0ABW1YGV5_9DEIO